MVDATQAASVRREGARLTLPIAFLSIGITCFVAVYVVMVGTQGGRATDTQWTVRAFPESSAAIQINPTNEIIMSVLSPTHLMAVGLILVLATLSARQWWRALAMSVAACGLVASASMLKSVLPRPGSDGQALVNSYPSGHVASAAAIAVALVLMASGRWRWPALLVGFALVAISATNTVSLQWHRPSDAVGAASLALSWYGIGVTVLQRGGRVVRSSVSDGSTRA